MIGIRKKRNKRRVYTKSSACGLAIMDTLQDIQDMGMDCEYVKMLNCDRCGEYNLVSDVSCDDNRQVCKKCEQMLRELTKKYG